MKKKIRSVGKILLDIEPLLEELTDDHDMQWGDVLGLVYMWLQVHAPESQEVYLDGSKPILKYN